MKVYEYAPAGPTTEDPALAYDTVSYEPLLNVYETLVNYDGNSTDSFVPALATCVPGTVQCLTDYGTNLTAGWNSAGAPEYWTFVIDPAAQFYDPSTGNHWSVYPSDVMFSIARTLAFSDIPYAGLTAGWILSQSLEQYGNPSWDSATHYPYNNTPASILGSMLINDSTYCPTKAMNGIDGNGCVTFIANGSGQFWPFFLDLVANNLGASIVPCGWFTAQSAGLPGWSGSSAASGDGPCLLPDGGNSTKGASWSSYLARLGPQSWDALEESNFAWPSTQPAVQWSMVGSGPYFASVHPPVSYALTANPAYQQPSGCSGAAGLAVYSGYCDPSPEGYIHSVNVTWESSYSPGITALEAGTADFAPIDSSNTSTMLSLASDGRLSYYLIPTMISFITSVNLAFNSGVYHTDFPSQPAQTISSTAFSDLGLRNFYVDSYPYTTVEDTVRTVDGIQSSFNSGGAIPYGMGDYYPTNVSFPGGDPYHVGNHDPDTNPADVGGAAWWWAQITTPSSPYYDSYVATSCTRATPCTWAIAGLVGDPANDSAIADWIAEIVSLTGGALHPFGGSSFDLNITQLLMTGFSQPYYDPLVSEVGLGYAPDYPDPTDYVAPYLQPDSNYTAPPAFYEQTNQPQYDNVGTCGHNAVTVANLDYWAHAAQNPASGVFSSACQGVAYDVASGYMNIAGAMPQSTQRVLYYDLIEQITNRLAMYVWNGQNNELEVTAPWIQGSSINMNSMIGAGGDQIWYQVRYLSNEFPVTFTETGLPSGTSWSVTLNGTTDRSTGPQIRFSEPDGEYDYSIGGVPGYAATQSFGTIEVSGAPVAVNVPFSQVVYAVTCTESGLPKGTSWLVVLGGNEQTSNGTSIVYDEPNGTYPFSIAPVPGYAPTPASGSLTVSGANASLLIGFTPVPYPVTFTEWGLPNNTTWWVALNGSLERSTGRTITFNESIGSYSYTIGMVPGYVPEASSGTVTVTGAPLNVTVSFSQVVYVVTFTEAALPAGTSWLVVLNGIEQNSTGTSIIFEEPNGTYNYSIGGVPGYLASPSSGSVTVNGVPVTLAVSYVRQALLWVSVSPASAWVTVNGQSMTGSVGTYLWTLSPGAYYVNATAPGFAPYSNLVTVTAAENLTLLITLTPLPSFGYLVGNVTPATATVIANGVIVPVQNGTFDVTLTPGTYYLSVTAPGYGSLVTETIIWPNQVTQVNVALTAVTTTVTLSGVVSPANASVVLDGFVAYVNATGYYQVSIVPGTYAVSVSAPGYFPYAESLTIAVNTTANFSLVKEPTSTSTETTSHVTAIGYNVTVANLSMGNGNITVTFNSTGSGTLLITIPYADVANVTLAELLSSRVYVNGVRYSDFTVTVTSNYTVTLTVRGLSGDPTLFWALSPTSAPPSYAVTFTESGLPPGMAWSVTLGGTLHSSTTSSITFSEPVGTYAYTLEAVPGYTPTLSSGSLSVNGASVRITIEFAKSTYHLTFTESGLPSGTMWSITLNGSTQSSTGTSIVFTERDGTYGYTLGGVAGFTASPPSGSITVNEANVSIAITFAPSVYSVTFSESGLPSGTSWSVTFGGDTQFSTGTEITFSDELNGTYGFTVGAVPGYAASPSSGTATIRGANIETDITFTPGYALTFFESGLPVGTLWNVTVGATSLSSTGMSISFAVPNGTYAYVIGIVPGYAPNHGSGIVEVSGGPVSIDVTFTLVKYSVTFTESGLPSGKVWSVALGGIQVQMSTSGPSIVFFVPNGSYTFLVTGPSGYRVSGLTPEGTIVVDGANVPETFVFVKGPTYSLVFREAGLAVGTSWCVTIGWTVCTTKTSLTFKDLTPGTYQYAIGTFAGMTTLMKLGSAWVIQSAGTTIVAKSETFQVQFAYAVTFTETGLPSGTSWSVTAQGSTYSSTSSTIVLYATNGTVGFSVHPVSGYTRSPTSGHVTVTGGPVSVSVTFTSKKAHQPAGGPASAPLLYREARLP